MTIECEGRKSVDQEVNYEVTRDREFYYSVTMKGYGPGKGGYLIYSLMRHYGGFSGFLFGSTQYMNQTEIISVGAGETEYLADTGFPIKGS